MRNVLLIPFFWVSIIGLVNGQHNFSVENIPDSLKYKADAVYRFNNITYTRISEEKYTVEVHYAVTILNESGKSAARLNIHYDRNSTVTDIKGIFYQEHGITVGKLKKKQVNDYVAHSSFTLFSDHRVKSFSPAYNKYPFTTEYEYSVEYSGVVGFNTWIPQKWYGASLEKGELIFKTPVGLDIKYLQLNGGFDLQTTMQDGLKQYKWNIENLKAIEYEPYSPNYLDVLPAVALSPNQIGYEGTKGDFSSWNSYGKWVYGLLEGRDVLPEETVSKIKALTDSIPEQEKKIEAVYKYMQGKTRYVNIALGIGGFQPITASDVDEKGYGDCKALVNYTRALLQCAGIESYYAEIGSGRYQEIKYPDFASTHQTNHIVLCVPNKKDTIWLECTNQNMPFGYLGSNNLNRYALLIRPEGGILAKTPNLNEKSNLRSSHIELVINDSGNAGFKLETRYRNYMFEEIFGLVTTSNKEQKQALLKGLAVGGLDITNFTIEETPGKNPGAKLMVQGSLSQYATKAGNRLFFKPEYFFREKGINKIPDDRKQNIYISQGYSLADTLNISIPDSYKIEYFQENSALESVYGKYSLKVENRDNAIKIIRNITINQGTYENSVFDEINTFLQDIEKKENQKIIAIKKEG